MKVHYIIDKKMSNMVIFITRSPVGEASTMSGRAMVELIFSLKRECDMNIEAV